MKDELKPIIEGLLKKSKEDQVAWVHASTVSTFSEAEIDPSAEDYAVSTSNLTINVFTVTSQKDNETKKGISFTILDEVGRVVINETVYRGEPDYAPLGNLLLLARKHVRSQEQEKVLKRVLAGLNKPGVFGSTDTEPPSY